MVEVLRIGGDSKWTDAETSAEYIGGKAVSLVKMSAMGLNVPPAIVIPCAVTFDWYKAPKGTAKELRASVEAGLAWIEKQVGRKCLYSVRSGAPVSLPGMMDTVLNVGLNDTTLDGMGHVLPPRALWDSYRRLMQMYGSVVLGLDVSAFDAEAGLPVEKLREIVDQAKGVQALANLRKMPVIDQVMGCVGAVFNSWNSPRAIEYRRINNIPDTLGTAVTIQAMVYGNLNDQSGSGVLFSRNPATGAKEIVAEYLMNAQGEDVVSGTRTPMKLDVNKLVVKGPDWQNMLYICAQDLESAYKDMVDVEFTVENSKLYILQSRKGKRTPRAAVKIATDLLKEGVVDVAGLKNCLSIEQACAATTPSITSTGTAKLIAKGLASGGGIAAGKVCHGVQEAIGNSKMGPVVLVREQTEPDDIAGMYASVAIVTGKGGATCHAAVVSRAMNKACVVGIGDVSIADAEWIVVDGDTGNVWLDPDKSMVINQGDTQLIDLLAAEIAKKTNAYLVTDNPTLDGVKLATVVADRMFGGPHVVHTIDGVVDATAPAELGDPEDAEVWGLLKPVVDEVQLVATVETLKAHHKVGSKPVVISPPPSYKGPKVSNGRTVAEVFSGELVRVDPSFMKDVMGTREMYDKLVAAFGKPNVIGQIASPYGVVIDALSC